MFSGGLVWGNGCNALLSCCFFPGAAFVCFPWPDSWFLVLGLCVLVFDCHIDIDSLWAVWCIGFLAFLSQSVIRISIRFACSYSPLRGWWFVSWQFFLGTFGCEASFRTQELKIQPLCCIFHTWYCYQFPFHWVRIWNCYLFTSKFKPLWWSVFLNFQWQTSALHQVFRGSIVFPVQFWVWGSYFFLVSQILCVKLVLQIVL